MKIENYKLDGVLNQDHAYQIGMRRLMKYLQQRVTFQTTTELDALCYNWAIALCSRMIFRVTTRFPVWWRR
nr:Uncharacterised protein [Klebsiella pneumoniae]